MSFLRRSEREWANNSVVEPALSDGAAQVLAVIGRAYVVVDEVGGVAQASPGAYWCAGTRWFLSSCPR